MNFRCDAAPGGWRDEVIPDFEGRAQLERAILGAHNRSDDDELHRLQTEYRAARRGETRTRNIDAPSTVASAPTRTLDVEHSLVAYPLTWRATVPCSMTNGKPAMLRLRPDSLTKWLRTIDLDDTPVPVIWHHGQTDVQGVLGTLWDAIVDDTGLRCTLQLRDEPAAHEVMLAADKGKLALSINCRVTWSEDSGQRLGGLPLFEMTEGGLAEISLLARNDAADSNALIVMVGGERAAYLRAQDRDATLRQTFDFPERRIPWGIPPWRQ